MVRDSIKHCMSRWDCSSFTKRRYSNVLIQIFYHNLLEMQAFASADGGVSPPCRKPGALTPHFGRWSIRLPRWWNSSTRNTALDLGGWAFSHNLSCYWHQSIDRLVLLFSFAPSYACIKRKARVCLESTFWPSS